MENLTEKKTILILEDSPTQALLLKESLEEKGYLVHAAKDGVEGLQVIIESPPDLIISDIDMPRMNGYDFCQHIRQTPNFKGIPVILLTNLTDTMDVIKGIECGADSFLTKPFEIELLLSTMRDALNSKSIERKGGNEQKLEFFFGGKSHLLNIDEVQVTDLLLSTFSAAIQKNVELSKAYRKLNLIHEELEKKTVQLEKLNKEKNEFLGMAAHDLRNPLAVIEGYSKLILDKLSKSQEGKIISMLESIQRSSAFMLGLINDLLDVSVIESGIVKLHLSEFNIVNLVEETINLVTKQATNKEITMVLEPDNPLIQVTCDKNKIEQVLINLLTNAIKFSNPQTSVKVSVTTQSNDVVLKVKDQGVGIPEEETKNLFKPFSKTSAKSTAGESSTGLGLAIAKKIVQAHYGSIEIESQIGEGSTFTVTLPRHPPKKSEGES